jgi:hypothetical protein
MSHGYSMHMPVNMFKQWIPLFSYEFAVVVKEKRRDEMAVTNLKHMEHLKLYLLMGCTFFLLYTVFY